MKRITKKIQLNQLNDFKNGLLKWSQQFDKIVWLDSNVFANVKNQDYSNFDAVLAVESEQEIKSDFNKGWLKLKDFQTKTNDYIFGYLGYDLKNDIENLSSNNFDGLEFDDIYFFQPKKLFFFKENFIELSYLPHYEEEIEKDLHDILHMGQPSTIGSAQEEIKILKRISDTDYFQKIDNILHHIHRGDIYEVNFCQEFYAEHVEIDPLSVYQKLNKISSPPFATFLKLENNYLLSASPERFVKRVGNQIISQPIKGTARRHKDPSKDLKIATLLKADTKERAENIMIVDLVRNDLSKTAVKGTVEVEELCEVYTFKQVHQLISTVTSTVEKHFDSIDIIKSMFPMGSMTGAPKISAMKIIEEEEETKRGLYSGAVGYFNPVGDFDFNVVIRSVFYNKIKKYVSFSVGGAITAKSNPKNEYQECLLKAQAMKDALQNMNN